MPLTSTRIFILQCLLLIAVGESANILGIALYDGKSHWLVMESILKSLINAGHRVTVISPYSSDLRNNFSLIDVSKTLPLRTNSFPFELVSKEYYHPYKAIEIIPNLSFRQCDKAHALPEVQKLLQGKPKFDVVISEIFGVDCDAVFAHLLDVPLISVVTSTLLPWAGIRVGNPENPAYISNILLPYTDIMTFSERLLNTIYYVYIIFKYNTYNSMVTSLNRKHFGNNIPPVEKIMQNSALIFVNSHYTVDVPRPFVPNIIEIGGIHLPPVKPLPKDLANFMDNAKNGVIYFSLGSIIRAASLPNETIDAMKKAFAELDLNVLWKFEDESIEVSSNVLVRNWFPQRDILAHPNLKLVIFHGGLMGIYEAIDKAVPILGIPVFFDQHRNIINLVSRGCALRLEIDKITKDYFSSNIKQVLEDKRFKERAIQLSRRFHDRIVKPSDAVVYWTEYVIKYEGARHLRSAAADMPWYQYLLLDVLGFVLIVISIISLIVLKLLKIVFKLFKPSKAKIIPNGIHLKTY